VKGKQIGPDAIQTEAFDVAPGEGTVLEFPKRAAPPKTLDEAIEDFRQTMVLAGRTLREGLNRAYVPGHRWRDPATGRFIPRRR
jgi:hypothetical protein